MAQVLPSFADQLAPAIQSIVGAIQERIHPNLALQKGMQQALVTNPGLLQNLANIEKSSPGLMHRFGLGALSDLIASVPETAEAEISRTARPDIVKGAVGEAKNKAQKVTIDSSILAKASELLAKGDATSTDAALKLLQLPTTLEKRGQEARVGAAELELEDMVRNNERIKKIPELSSKFGSTRDIARALMTGKLDPEAGRIIFSDPTLAKSVQVAADQLQSEQEFGWRKELQRIANENRVSSRGELTSNFMVQKAFQMFDQSNVGNLDAWEAVLFNPNEMERAIQLGKTGSSKPADLPFVEIGKYLGDQQSANQLAQLKNKVKITDSIIRAERDLDQAKGDERQSKIASLQLLLDERAKLGGPKVTVSYEDRLGPFNRIVYKDETGRRLSEKEVNVVVKDPTATTTLTGLQQQYASSIIALEPALRIAALSKLEAEDDSPGKRDTKAIREYLKSTGLLADSEKAVKRDTAAREAKERIRSAKGYNVTPPPKKDSGSGGKPLKQLSEPPIQQQSILQSMVKPLYQIPSTPMVTDTIDRISTVTGRKKLLPPVDISNWILKLTDAFLYGPFTKQHFHPHIVKRRKK